MAAASPSRSWSPSTTLSPWQQAPLCQSGLRGGGVAGDGGLDFDGDLVLETLKDMGGSLAISETGS